MGKVKMEDVLQAIELADDGGNCYYNKITGKIIYIDDETRRMAENYDEDDVERLLEWQLDDVKAAIDVEKIGITISHCHQNLILMSMILWFNFVIP